jgi:hypothetical protein
MGASLTPTGSGRAPAVDYGGRRFRPVDNQHYPAGTPTPTGLYYQDGDLVWAEFAGASIRAGRLVGRCRPDGTIDAAYCWVTASGETMAGSCVSSPTVLADGRVRLTERWRRLDGAVGVSYVEEVRLVEEGTGER